MALFRGIQEYIALDANNITLVFDSGNIVNISGNIFLYPPQGHPILYNYVVYMRVMLQCINWHCSVSDQDFFNTDDVPQNGQLFKTQIEIASPTAFRSGLIGSGSNSFFCGL